MLTLGQVRLSKGKIWLDSSPHDLEIKEKALFFCDYELFKKK